MTDIDTKIEEAMAEGMRQSAFPPRPPVYTEPERRNQQAMQRVDREHTIQALQVEAFIDQALHARIMLMRGVYLPGPRDVHVRHMIMQALDSISSDNSHALDP
jgi:hypothetical protein